MKKTISLLIACLCVTVSASAQRNSDRVSLGVGLLYENGLDATIAYEHELNYHNSFEVFAGGYLKWTKCASCGHICSESFWWNYRSHGLGFANKPCVVRGCNHFVNEHNYMLHSGWVLYWQVKSDVMINGQDLFRTGVVLGFKIPVKEQ